MSKARLHVQVPVPSYFVCPISLELMLDPVTLSSGQTFDRASIEKWLQEGHATCPVTRQPINAEEEEPIPNHTLRRMIQAWCEENQSLGVQRIVTPRQPPSVKDIPTLVESLIPSRNSADPADAIQKLISLASDRPKSRRLIAEQSTPHLFKLLSRSASNSPSSSASSTTLTPRSSASISDHILRLLDLLTSDDPNLCRIVFHSPFDLDFHLLLPLSAIAARSRPESRLCAVRLLLRMQMTEAMKKKVVCSPGFMEGLVEMMTMNREGGGAAAARGAALSLMVELCRGCQRGRVAAVEAGAVECAAEILGGGGGGGGDDNGDDEDEAAAAENSKIRWREASMELMEIVCHCAEGREAVASRLRLVVKNMSGVSERVSYLALHILWLLIKSSPDSDSIKSMAFKHGAHVTSVAIAQSLAPSQTRQVARHVSAALLEHHARSYGGPAPSSLRVLR